MYLQQSLLPRKTPDKRRHVTGLQGLSKIRALKSQVLCLARGKMLVIPSFLKEMVKPTVHMFQSFPKPTPWLSFFQPAKRAHVVARP